MQAHALLFCALLAALFESLLRQEVVQYIDIECVAESLSPVIFKFKLRFDVDKLLASFFKIH